MHTTENTVQLPFVCLPQETLDVTFAELSRSDLASVALVNSNFRAIATRLLYRNLDEMKPAPLIRCLISLSRYDTGIAHVRRLEIAWTSQYILHSGILLIHRVLTRLKNLQTLTLDFPPEVIDESFSWMLQDLPFSLVSFTTSLPAGPALARFLDVQSRLEELCLRGFSRRNGFPLPQTALPRLTTFRSLHATPSILRTIVKGRTINSITLSFSLEHTGLLLQEIHHSACPVRRLTLLGLSLADPIGLISEVTRQLPGLEACHIFALLLPFEDRQELKSMLIQAGSYLSKFTSVRYLTFMAGGSSGLIDDQDEGEIATAWAAACPSVQTIILPRGKVWFQRENRWTNLE